MLNLLKTVNWRIFFILFVAGLLGVIAVLPFTFDLLGSLPITQGAAPDLPLPAVVALALLQNGILLAAAILTGMRLSERVGLQMPLVRAWATGATTTRPQAILVPGFLVGAASGVVLVGLEALFFLRNLPEPVHQLFAIPLWKRLLAGIVYGGITEELLMRLFLLSLVAWLLGRWWKGPEARPTIGAFWTAIIVVAVVFGLGHLPATAALTPLTPVMIARALVLNGVAGVAFGYLYWRHGLEAAMAGHMSTHLVLQVPGVMLLTRMQ
jgi:membrane protease YdiL (CAAX protease family)